jgi:hypothetical protein
MAAQADPDAAISRRSGAGAELQGSVLHGSVPGGRRCYWTVPERSKAVSRRRQGSIRSFLRGLDDVVTRLPIWPRMETEVTPLITFEARALALRPRLDELKARVRA